MKRYSHPTPQREGVETANAAQIYISENENTNNIKSVIPGVGGLYSPFEYKRRESFEISNIGSKHVPVVVADFSKFEKLHRKIYKTLVTLTMLQQINGILVMPLRIIYILLLR